MNIIKILMVAVAMLKVSTLNGQSFKATNDLTLSAPNFNRLSYDEASKVVDKIVKSKPQPTEKYVADLVRQVGDKTSSDEAKVFAIYLLGEMRVTNLAALNILIENVDINAPKRDMAIKIGRWGAYPAQEALIKIGPAVIKPIVEHLVDEQSQKRRYLLCVVLRDIQGKADATKILKSRAEYEKDSAKLSNLNAAISELEHLP